ncbi:ATP-binding protein [Marivirga sp. S37H4]|uniref:ATP-binding protein n=1 Tax=Marivirga aurantiaca TaxID=2802615 RepID=A0A935CD69_9BACT|nr:ATP-binding protein [Marivirga aurantiaca]MBK6266623.1 ATP-binding protein [Marivirga aurantiaca]
MNKIAIIGPESTGKSTISQGLAHHFNEPFVPEYGRKYLEENGPDYSRADLLAISKGMVIWEDKMMSIAKNLLFCDTDLIMMKVWYEVKYGECHPWVLQQIETNPYQFYLLCKPDLPWEADPLRENPTIRELLFNRYQEELEAYGFDYSIISGKEKRLQNAIEEVEIIENKKRD